MPDNNLWKGIAGESQGLVLSSNLFIRLHGISRLNVNFLASFGSDAIDFPRNLHGIAGLALLKTVYDSDIDSAPADDQLIIDNILHDVCQFLLAETDAGVAQAGVLTVVFVGVLKIRLALHIIAFAFTEQEGIFQVLHVGGDSVLRHAVRAIEFLNSC